MTEEKKMTEEQIINPEPETGPENEQTVEQNTNPSAESNKVKQSSDKKWKILVAVMAVLLILCGTWIIWVTRSMASLMLRPCD